MKDAGTSEEDDDIDSQDSNTPIDHGHLARNCLIISGRLSVEVVFTLYMCVHVFFIYELKEVSEDIH